MLPKSSNSAPEHAEQLHLYSSGILHVVEEERPAIGQSNRPTLVAIAPVNALVMSEDSLSSSPVGIAAQIHSRAFAPASFAIVKRPSNQSFPLPVSPKIRTVNPSQPPSDLLKPVESPLSPTISRSCTRSEFLFQVQLLL